MITPAAGVRIWLAAGLTDMRKGFDGLAALVQQHLGQDPFSGHSVRVPRQARPTTNILHTVCALRRSLIHGTRWQVGR